MHRYFGPTQFRYRSNLTLKRAANALIKAAGHFRPDRDELARRKKDGKLVAKRKKKKSKIKPLVKKRNSPCA
jgi:hypothetical protein